MSAGRYTELLTESNLLLPCSRNETLSYPSLQISSGFHRLRFVAYHCCRKGMAMNRRLLWLPTLLLLAAGTSAEAQQQKKIPRIGYLGLSAAPTSTYRIDAFRQGLRQLGYVEGKDFVIEYRSADGKVDR